MREVSHAILSTLFFCILTVTSLAQNAQHPWSISAGAVFIKYHAPSSLSPLGNPAYQPAVQLSLGKYLGGAFDFRTQFTAAHQISFPAPLSELPSNTVKTMLMDMSYLLSFKINNGVFIKKNSFFGPYAVFGIGGSYVEQNPDVYIPLGGGIKFRLSDRMDIRVESIKKFSVNKDFQHTAHALSVSYNVGKSKQQFFQDNISEEKIIENTRPLDTDGDGILDEDDLCPKVMGLSKFFGCPEEEAEEIVPITQLQEKDKNLPSQQIDLDQTPNQALSEETENPENIAEKKSEPESEVIKEKIPITPSPIQTPITPSNQVAVSDPVGNKKSHAETPVEEKIPCNVEFSSNDFSIYFNPSSAELPDLAKTKLDEVADLMQACMSSKLVLQGHTDAIGEDRKNKALSVIRAHRVKYYLVYEHGISQSRIESEGYGESKPKADNQTNQGRERNRRVDFTLIR